MMCESSENVGLCEEVKRIGGTWVLPGCLLGSGHPWDRVGIWSVLDGRIDGREVHEDKAGVCGQRGRGWR
jgi:hypothetical protein